MQTTNILSPSTSFSVISGDSNSGSTPPRARFGRRRPLQRKARDRESPSPYKANKDDKPTDLAAPEVKDVGARKSAKSEKNHVEKALDPTMAKNLVKAVVNAELEPQEAEPVGEETKEPVSTGFNINPPWDSSFADVGQEDEEKPRGRRRRRRTISKSPNRDLLSAKIPAKSPNLSPTPNRLAPKPNLLSANMAGSSPNLTPTLTRMKKRPSPRRRVVSLSPGNNRVPKSGLAEAKKRRASLRGRTGLATLTPQREKAAVNNVRKMIEGFIDAASTKAELEVIKGSRGDKELLKSPGKMQRKKESVEEFNVEIAARRLVLMVQRNDWIAFEQSLK